MMFHEFVAARVAATAEEAVMLAPDYFETSEPVSSYIYPGKLVIERRNGGLYLCIGNTEMSAVEDTDAARQPLEVELYDYAVSDGHIPAPSTAPTDADETPHNAWLRRVAEQRPFWLAQGFSEVGTGGNCTAYEKRRADGYYVLIIAVDDATVPDSEQVCISTYTQNEHSEADYDGEHSRDDAANLARAFLEDDEDLWWTIVSRNSANPGV